MTESKYKLIDVSKGTMSKYYPIHILDEKGEHLFSIQEFPQFEIRFKDRIISSEELRNLLLKIKE